MFLRQIVCFCPHPWKIFPSPWKKSADAHAWVCLRLKSVILTYSPSDLLSLASIFNVVTCRGPVIGVITQWVKVVWLEPDFSGRLKFPDFTSRIDRFGATATATRCLFDIGEKQDRKFKKKNFYHYFGFRGNFKKQLISKFLNQCFLTAACCP
jgi:hypothetical protein